MLSFEYYNKLVVGTQKLMFAFEVLFISPIFSGFLLAAEKTQIKCLRHFRILSSSCERLELEFSTEVSRILWLVVFMLSIFFHFHSTNNHIGSLKILLSLKRPNTQHAQNESINNKHHNGEQRFEYFVVFPHFRRLNRKRFGLSLLISKQTVRICFPHFAGPGQFLLILTH